MFLRIPFMTRSTIKDKVINMLDCLYVCHFSRDLSSSRFTKLTSDLTGSILSWNDGPIYYVDDTTT